MHRTLYGLFITTWILLAGWTISIAAPMFVSDDRGNIGQLDPVSGAVSNVFNPGAGAFTDIAFDNTGTLYGITFRDLYRIDIFAQTATEIGRYRRFNTDLNALIIDEDNTAYAMGPTRDRLYTIDLDTGRNRSVGRTGWYADGDLEMVGGELYLSGSRRTNGGDRTSSLVALDPATGAARLVGDIGIDNVYGLAYMDNLLYAIAGQNVFELDPDTGIPGPAVSYGGAGLGTVWGAAGAPVPEPGTIVLLGAGLAGAAIAGRRRRRRKA